MAAESERILLRYGLEPDPVIEAYKRDIDRTLLRQNLRRSVAERMANLIALQRLAVEARRAGQKRTEALADPEALLKERTGSSEE